MFRPLVEMVSAKVSRWGNGMSGYDVNELVEVLAEDQRLAEAQRLLDMCPMLADWARGAALQLSTALTNGIFDGIRPGYHIHFRPYPRPSRRANRRAHSRKMKR